MPVSSSGRRHRRVTLSLKQTADLTAPVQLIHELVSVLRTSTNTDLKTWANSVLDHACRQMECFASPEVSIRAAEEATAQGLPDLRTFTWKDQVGRMGDIGREVFHWEHVLPVAELKRRLLDSDTRSLEDVRKILASVDIAWILKSEDACLTSNGFSHRRPGNPWEAYSKAGVAIQRGGKE